MFRVIVFFSLFFAISCSNKVQDINESREASSFQNTPVSLVGSVEHKSLWSDAAWNDLPSYAIFKFKTCLKDKAINNPIIDESFHIKSPVSKQVLKTNIDGCLVWSERVEFNYLEKEKLLNFPIELTGTGNYKGYRSFSLALNPWPEAATSMVFLEDDSTLSQSFTIVEINEKSDEDSVIEDNLIIENISFSKRPSEMLSESKNFNMDISFKTALVSKGLNGENKIARSISKGRFKAVFKILETPEASHENYLISSTEIETSANSGSIQESLSFNIPKSIKFNDRSFISMEIELKPLNAPLNIATERVLIPNFNIEDPNASLVNRISESSSLVKRPASPILSNSSIDPSVDYPLEDIIIGDEIEGDDDRGYYIKKVESITRGSIVNHSYNKSSNKTRRAKFTLCLNEETSSSNQIPLSDTQVKVDVTLKNGKSDLPDSQRVYKTNEDGCIDSYANITYDKYSLERWIPFNVKVTPLSGHYNGLVKTRKLTVNPWNPEDFGYDTKFETEIPEIKGQSPRIFIGNVDYQKDMLDYSEFKINEYLHLSLKRKYRFNFSPKVELFHSYRDETTTESLTFGKYEIKVSLFSPKTPDVNYYNPDMNNFKFITAAKKNIKVLPNGTIADIISFPFLVSETQELAHKNLALLEIKSIDNNSTLRPVKVIFPFFGGNQGAKMPAFVYEKELPATVIAKIDNVINNGKALAQIDTQSDPHLDPLNIFVDSFKISGEAINSKVVIKNMNLREFNKSIANIEKKNIINSRELRTLVSENTLKTPKSILNKFCAHFYNPLVKENKNDYSTCVNSPNEHLKATPLTHIKKILSRKNDQSKSAYASFVNSTRGKVSRGNAFFAAYGDRSSSVSGESENEIFSSSMDYGIRIPFPAFTGYSKGHIKEYGMFKQKNRADMEAAFDRFYSQRELSSLEFDQLKLKFYASVRRCVSVVGINTNSVKIHLCEEKNKTKEIEEEWFFIGDTRSREHGLIADGAFPGLTSFTQIIRGKYNYNRMWNKYKEEDITLVLEEVGESRGKTYAFERFLNESKVGMPYENFIDNSQPGLYITPRH